MEEQFKEIEGLLESTAHVEPDTAHNRIKKYVKLVFPHVALVAVVCLYAVIGAYIFYRLESPNEDWLKQQGKESIGKMRGRLIGLIKEGHGSKRDWKGSVESELYRFNDDIYKAFKEQYVRYPDVKVSQRYDISEEREDGDRTKRHRNSKSRGERSEKMWTASSALFFAATTMATIGYGNIVPATPSGRIACVVFALFGAPLAIITIGDLGKFLSECTIWLYKQMKKGRIHIRNRWRRFRLGKGNLDDCEMQSEESSRSSLDWEDLVMDKTEVPVLMVFTILLLYIAFGGILFSFLEGWSYMDAFYYSFISLTTIGFGDIVPENHDYIVLMLIYLGVGLAVTTMCIDLVGIQYIQKIHYFGRKFRGTDLLHLLKRKRMIERRLAMGQGDELLQLYMQQMQSQIPEPVVVEERYSEEKCPSPSEWLIDDALMSSRLSYTYPLAEKVPSPNVLSIRSFRVPSIYSNSSASARMHLRLGGRGGSWDESGPSLSEHCSLSTEPSVHIRRAYWDEYRSPDPSITSFQFSFPLPSPDYHEIAQAARASRRLNSCPADPPWPPSHSSSVSSARTNRAREGVTHPPLLQHPLTSFRIPEPFMLSNLAAQCDILDALEDALRFQSPRGAPLASKPTSPPPNLNVPTIHEQPRPVHVPPLVLKDCCSPPSSSRLSSSLRSPLFPILERRKSIVPPPMAPKEETPVPLLKRKKRERLAKMADPLHNVDWLNISPRATAMKVIKEDLPTLFDVVRRTPSQATSTNTSSPVERTLPSIVLVSPRNPVGLACMEDWDSYIRMLEEYEKPYERVPSPIPTPPGAPLSYSSPSLSTSPPRFESPSPPLPTPPPLTPSPVTAISPISVSAHESPVPSPPLPRVVEEVPPCRCFAVATPVAASLVSEMATIHRKASSHLVSRPLPKSPPMEFLFLESRMPLVVEEREDPPEKPPSPMAAESSSEDEGPSGFDLDLGAFELVDSGLSAETLLSTEEPVIFHQDLPVHSVHHDTVQTEAALANLMAAPASMLTAAIPPTMVEDNYCFVVDGERVKMGDILGDDQWWRHTSRPTKYFYSEDLRQFHRVNCITAKGKVIAAKLVAGSLHVQGPPSSASTTPRSSVSGTSSRTAGNGNKVPLCHVYKVIRFYSFWKTCTSFHRIVTMIDKVSGDERSMNPDFKKRLFVQYLWRNAKAVEKARVQKEFDPRRQRLLRFVTDPNARKRFNKMFVEDDTCTFAVILDDVGLYPIQRGRLERVPHIDREESEDSTIDFPVQVNAMPVRKNAEENEVLLHYGDSDDPVPVFSVGEKPLDGPSTLNNIIHCPVKYICKTPPSLVVDNYCFICDGDEVTEEDILKDKHWWKETSNTTRHYSSDNLTTFHQVTLLQCRGEIRGAYRTKERGGGLTKVSLDQVFRVSRYFSCWRTCHGFHRIVSVISPVTEEGEQSNRFKKRIFIQYFWRQEKKQDREMVQREYMDFKMKSPRHSLVPPPTSYRSRAQYPSSSSSMSSFDSTSPRHSTVREDSKWRLLNRVYQSKRAFLSSRRDTTLSLRGTTK